MRINAAYPPDHLHLTCTTYSQDMFFRGILLQSHELGESASSITTNLLDSSRAPPSLIWFATFSRHLRPNSGIMRQVE